MRFRVVLLLTATLICCSCRTPEESSPSGNPEETTIVLRLTTGPPGGGFFPLGEHVATRLRARMSAIDVQIVASGGAIFNIEAIQDGRADVGFSFADVAYMGFNGLLAGRSAPLSLLRGVAVLQLIPISLVVRHGLDIRDPGGLVGRRVSVGPSGSGTALTARLLLHEFGVDPPAVHLETLNFQESSSRLMAGALDAMFDNAIVPDSIRRATDAGAHLVPIVGAPVDRLRRNYPFLKPATIPAGRYPQMDKSVHTIGVDGLLICSANLDDRLVYELTKQFSNMIAESQDGDPLRLMELDAAPATPIPLHDGAARYYRERELVSQR
jgi:TRAP transporter TAXI family solute receptor